MAKNPKSVISFTRRSLKIRGNSYHEGRGFVTMEHDSSPEVLVPALKALAGKHEFIKYSERLVTSGKWNEAEKRFVSVPNVTIAMLKFANLVPDEGPFGSADNYYRTIQYNTLNNELVCTM